jgi:predicted NBD/HSP70 family sugar kinase
MTRHDIQQATGLSPAATARITAGLEAEQLITRTRQAPSTGGRPPWRYQFVATGRYLAGLRIQEDGCRAILTTWSGTVVARTEVLVDVRTATDKDILAATFECAEHVLQAARGRGRGLLAIGVAFPGVVTDRDVVHAGAEIDWGDFSLGSELARRMSLPVVVENDANLLALSELDVSDQGRSLAALILGHGVGAGIVAEGRLLRGSSSSAGEIGFLPTDASRLGTEAFATGDLEAHVQAALQQPGAGPHPPSVRLWSLLDRPVPGARVHEALDYLAMALGSLIVVIDPERIVIGDVPDDAARLLIEQLQGRLSRLRPHVPEIVTARRGGDAVLIGAVALAADLVDLQAH